MPGAATGAMVEPSPIWEVKMDDPKRSKDREDEELEVESAADRANRELNMDDPKRREYRPEDEELEVDEKDVSDIDVPDEDAEEAKGGMMAEEKPTRGRDCTYVGCRTRSGCL